MLNHKVLVVMIAATLLITGCSRKQKVVEPVAGTQYAAPQTSAVQPAYASTTKRSQAPYSK